MRIKNHFKTLGIFFLPVLLLACTPGVQVKTNDAGKQFKAVDGIWVNCKNVYKFTKDCNVFSGAERQIELEGYKLKIAGSQDGRHILVMDSGRYSRIYKIMLAATASPFLLYDQTLYHFPENQKAENGFEAILSKFSASGIGVTEVIAIMTKEELIGYIFSVDKDAYSVLANAHSS